MPVWGWCILIVALLIANFGGWWTVVLFLWLGAFAMGVVSFFYSKTAEPLIDYYAHKVNRRCSKPGIRKIIESMQSSEKDVKLDRRLTGSQIIDETMQEIFGYILNDYVYIWWDKISAQDDFIVSIREYVQKIVIHLAARMKETSWTSYITTRLVDDFASHIRLYRQACEKANVSTEAKKKAPISLASFKSATQSGHSRSNSDGAKSHSRNNSSGDKSVDLEGTFFQLELEMEMKCRENICTGKDVEKKHLENIVDVVLYHALPVEDFDCIPVRLLVREILLGGLLLPLFDILSDPDYLNLWLISLSKDVPLSSEAFITALRTTPNREELLALQEVINHEANVLRNSDGVETDSNVKIQLHELNYIKRLVESRLQGGLFKDKNFDDKSKLVLLKLNVILKHNLALSYYIDYLSTINMQNYIFLYLSLESWKHCVQTEKLRGDNITLRKLSKVPLEHLRESASNICDQYLAEGVPSNVSISSAVKSNLLGKINREPVNESWFDDLIKQLLEKLENTLSDFYRSNVYVKLLSELDLLKDSEQDEETQSPDSISIMEEDEELRKENDIQEGKFQLKVNIIDCSVVQDKGKTYGIYALSVTRTCDGGSTDKWIVYRRYSDFYDLHQKVNDAYSHLSKLPFPGKKTFNNMEPSILAKRMKMLNDYLQILLGVTESNPLLLKMLASFFKPVEYDRCTNPLTSTIESVKGSMRTVSAAVKTMPDNFFSTVDGLSKVFHSPRRTPPGGRVSNALPNHDNYIPLRIILLLMDEVFDLHSRNQWLRRRIVTLLRQMFGDMVNRKILKFVEELTSTTKVASYLITLKNSLWPGGRRAPPKSPRDDASKVRTRVVAKTALLTLLYDEFKPILGSDTTRRGLLRVFALFQNRTLNRRFLHVLFEGITELLFPALVDINARLARRKDLKVVTNLRKV